MERIRLNSEIAKRLRGALQARVSRLGRLPFSAAVFLSAEIHRLCKRPVTAILGSPRILDEFRQQWEAFWASTKLLILPPEDWEFVFKKKPPQTAAAADSARWEALHQLTETPPAVIATSLQALMQHVPPPNTFREHLLCLSPGAKIEPATLAEHLAGLGYTFSSEVQAPGEAARRGGILDVWPGGWDAPVRLDFFGDTLETMRLFDPATQRAHTPAERLILPAGIDGQPAEWITPIAYLPPDTVYFWLELSPYQEGTASFEEHARIFLETAAALGRQEQVSALAEVRQAVRDQPAACELLAGNVVETGGMEIDLGFRLLAPPIGGADDLLTPDILANCRQKWVASLAHQAEHGRKVYFFFNTAGALERFKEIYPRFPGALRLGALTEGFENELLSLTVAAENDLYGQTKRQPLLRSRRRQEIAAASGESITDTLKIEPGDLVVHVDHGIGRYLGLYEIEIDRQRQEVLAVEYAEQARLYVPVSQAHLLSRYVGAGHGRTVALHRLGGTRWQHDKTAAYRAVRDLAAELLEIQALRSLRPGFAFPPDTPWQHEFETAFPYQETADQERAIQEVKRDMETPRPMDRLICGDAGYGKTEVAMRAAFKCATAGRQVALLAPTTVLAQQHFECFRARLAAYPVRVELLCRFQSPAAQARIIQDLRNGGVDIIIGTHRLLQPDIAFKDIGLLIIDEEQRFGVEHKEHFKRMKQTVDVLTMTATPIPRTLYLSLTGLREISAIQTPPQDRQPVETIIARDDDALIREAILRELNRDGQIYYLYNRVATIGRMAERLQRIAPEARLAIAHGQMGSGELAEVMRKFTQGAYDILLCTTIIESGLDIPNANTIIIDRADRFGLAELYQLRGRVGRSDRKAYAFFLLPAHSRPPGDAGKRLEAIAAHSGAGAGFRLAMRDLEIRGAGNLLGAAQSGHIAAIGFELYCQLLRQAIASLSGKQELIPLRQRPVELKLDFLCLSAGEGAAENGAYLPPDYIEDERARLEFFRRLAAIANRRELAALKAELRDRYGRIPPPLERLLTVAELRLAAAAADIEVVETHGNQVRLQRRGNYLQPNGNFPRLQEKNIAARLRELIKLVEHLKPSETGDVKQREMEAGEGN